MRYNLADHWRASHSRMADNEPSPSFERVPKLCLVLVGVNCKATDNGTGESDGDWAIPIGSHDSPPHGDW